MKYIRRAVKYFIQISIIFVLIIGILMLTGMVDSNVDVAFRNGWKSVGLIFAAFFAMGFVYPLFGYGKRRIPATGDPGEQWGAIDEAMTGRGYTLKEKTADGRKYILRSSVNRAARLWEDAITVSPVLGGFEAEGLVRDLARVVMAIERKLQV